MGVLTRLTKSPKVKGINTGYIPKGGGGTAGSDDVCLLSYGIVAAGAASVYKKSEGSLRVARSVVPGL